MKRIKNFSFFLFLLVATFTLVGCKQNNTPVNNLDSNGAVEQEKPEATPEPTEAPAEPQEVTITHELGEATLLQDPKNIIVFDYAALDILDTLGLGDRVIGLPKGNLPEFLKKFTGDEFKDVGTLFEPNYEVIAELAPELILISGRQAKLIEEFQAIAPTVYLPMASTEYFATFYANLETIGTIFGVEEAVAARITDMKAKVQQVNTDITALGGTALTIMANDGSLSAFGPASRFGVLYNDFGFIAVNPDIDESTHGQNISYEYILELNPTYLFVVDRNAVTGGDNTAAATLDNDLIKMTDAYKNDNIYYLDSFVWYVTAGGLQGTDIMIGEVESVAK